MASPVSGHRVVVIGAGVAGLVSALQLARRGLQVTLLEAA
ncbi:MAG: FAD-dependent oxidoreductase, partial [Burkholderiaceae bacterium]